MTTLRDGEPRANLGYGRVVAKPPKQRTPPAAEVAPIDRRRLLILGALALVAVLGCALLWFDINTQGVWGCTSVNVAAGTANGPTPEAAVAAYAATGAAPGDGWNNSEPNRYARTLDGKQMILDLNQRDVSTWSVVRFDTCGPGVT